MTKPFCRITATPCSVFIDALESRLMLAVTPVTFNHFVIDPAQTTLPVVKGLIDIYGNGTLDPVIGNNGGSGGLYWYSPPAAGPESGQPWVKHTIHSGGLFYEDVQTYDVNGDGAPDLITSHDNNMYWYQNPAGSGGDPTGIWTEHLIGAGIGHNISLADVDHDGKIDVITPHDIYFQNSPTSWTTVGSPNYNRVDNGVATMDVLHSGNQDILGIMPNSPYQFAWFENPLDSGGNPRTAVWTPHPIGGGSLDPTGDDTFAAGDLMGNGQLEIVECQTEVSNSVPQPPGLVEYIPPADPLTGTWTAVTIDSTYSDDHKLTLADMNGDGKLDIVTAEQEQSPNKRVSVFYNVGGGSTSGWQQQVLATTGEQNVRVGDINGDGNLDIYGANHGYFGANDQPEIWFSTLPSIANTPAAPSNLTAYAYSSTENTLSWTDNTNVLSGYKAALGFTIERSTDGHNFQQIGTVGEDVSLYTDSGLTPGQTYYYRVYARNASGNSPYSNVESPGGAVPSGPLVSAGPNQTIALPASSIQLQGSVVESGATLASTWTQISGPGSVSFADASSPVTIATFSSVGSYVLQLAGSDGTQTNISTVTITVNPDPGPSVSAGSNQAITLPVNTVSLAGSATETLPPGYSVSDSWSQVNGPAVVTFANGSAAATTATFPSAGTYLLQLSATDGIVSNSAQTTITVSPVGSYTGTPYPGPNPAAIPGTIQAENFDNGGEGVAYHDLDAANQGGANYRPGAGVDLQTTTDTGGGYQVGYINAGEWLKYSVNVQTTGTYSLDLRLSNKAAGGQLHVEVDGVNVTGTVNVPNTGSWTTWQTVTATGINLTAGNHVVRVSMDTNASDGFIGNLNWIRFNLTQAAPSGPTVSAGTNQTITLPSGAALSGSITESNPPGTLTSTWTQVSGPGTTTFANASSAATTATFSTSGTYVLQLAGSDGTATNTATVTITVNPAPVPGPVVNAGSSQTITPPAGATLSGSVTESNPPGTLTSTWTQVSGPGTTTFANANNAATTATFSASGTYVLQLSGSDGTTTNTATVTITVNPDPGPTVSGGSNQTITLPATASLNGSVTESGATLTSTWSQLSGPGTTTFANANSAATTASFSTSGTYVLQLAGSDGIQTNTAIVNITVDPVSTYKGTPFPGPSAPSIPGATIQAENFDSGGEGIAYHWQTTTNPGGANYRPGTGVGIQTTNDTGGGDNICYAVAGDWLKYTVTVAATGVYHLDLRVAQKAAGGQMHVEVDGVNVTGTVNVPNTGSWTTWQTVTLTGISLTAGAHVVKISFDTNANDNPGVANSQFVANLNWLKFY